VLQAANLSLGVNLLSDLVHKSAAFLGDTFDIEIIETHHNHKVDAPSGTALVLAAAAREGCLKQRHFTFGRHASNQQRDPAEIGIHAVRGGSVVGHHEVCFFGPDEELRLTHTAAARTLFARGALRAAAFVSGSEPGVYNMHDLLLAAERVTRLWVDREQAQIAVYVVPMAGVSAVFDAVADVNLDMISQTPPQEGLLDISFTCPRADAAEALAAVQAALHTYPGARAALDAPAVKLTLEGQGMPRYSGIAAQAFRTLAGTGAVIKAVTTSETKLSCLVSPEDAPAAEAALRREFGV